MRITRDPEGTETALLHEFVDFTGKHVLEVGCGDGRLTWRYAEKAAHVTAVDPRPENIAAALANRPSELGGRVDFLASSFEEFADPLAISTGFDIAILSWSL